MKKLASLVFVLGIFISAGSAFAATSTPSWDPTMTQAKSCKEVEGMLQEYFNMNWNGGYFGPVRGGVMMNDAMTKEAVSANGIGGGGGSDFSVTNNQKSGVEEPEIIKNDGKYIYYVDAQQNHEIHIVSAAGKKEGTISLPQDMWNAQLFLNNGKLIVLGAKSAPYIAYQTSIISRDQKTSIMIYNVANPKAPQLESAYEYDGYLQESRLVNNKFVLVTSQSFTWGPVYMMREKMMQDPAQQSMKPTDFTFTARDALPSWTSLQPTTITYKNGTKKFTTVKKTTQVDCTNVLYVKPDKKSSAYPQWGLSLSSIITFSLDTPRVAPVIKTIVGSSSQVHITKNTLYLTAPSYVSTPMSCPINARCLMPMWSQGSYTTIHQFSLPALNYNYSTAVKGTTYSQYSMDDTSGTFRIITSDTSNATSRVSTNVYTIDAQGKIAGKLENIAPGEQFYGTRFIDNYLYLVTYRQIDPLFVIDLSTASKPTIVGQLKMPGYSTYLHPFGAKQGNVQYLIGLGYNTSVDANGNERQGGIKLDLYKADFSQKDRAGNISVTQAWTKTFGEQGSQSDALNNPRMFVFNPTTKELLLPIVLATTAKTQQCSIVYGSNGAEIRKECYPMETSLTQFAGIKGRTLSTEGAKETISMDYKNILKNPYAYYGTTTSTGAIDPWLLSSLMPRVGYIGSTYYFINTQFAHLFSQNNLQGVRVDFPMKPVVYSTIDVAVPPSAVSPLKAE